MLAIADADADADQSPLPEKTDSDSPTPRVLSILSLVMERLVDRNEMLSLSGSSGRLGKNLEVFHGIRPPAITIPKYLDRIYKYTNCSPSCFVVGYIYIDRLVHRHPGSLVVSLNVHRLLVTSIMLAAKILDDEHYNNAFYARVGGVTNAELNRLELEFLFMLDFDLMVTSRVFESYCLYLEREMIMWNGTKSNSESGTRTNTIEDIAEISVEDMESFPSSLSNGVLA